MRKATFKRIFKILFHIIGILSVLGTFIFLFESFYSKDYSGKITKTSESREYKYVCHTFLVDFDKVGTRSISVTPGDFLRFDKDDYIIWSFSKMEIDPSMTSIEIILSLLIFCVYFSVVAVLYFPKIINKICKLYNLLED